MIHDLGLCLFVGNFHLITIFFFTYSKASDAQNICQKAYKFIRQKKGQYKAKVALNPCLYEKLLITAITAITNVPKAA